MTFDKDTNSLSDTEIINDATTNGGVLMFEAVDQDELKAIMEKYDKEAAYRHLSGFGKYLIIAISLAFSLFQLYTGLFGSLDAWQQRPILVLFVVVLTYLYYPATKKMAKDKLAIADIFLALASVFCWGYIVVFYRELIAKVAAYSTFDVVVAIIGILLLFEACRRVVGLPIMIISGIFLLYAYLGPYMPGFLNHRGYGIERIAVRMFYGLEGIMGTPISVCAKFIFLFILFGAFLEKTGIGQFFIDLANSVAGWASGGPAKVAVMTSALQGTISGSSVANTVGTGSFTIPMMKSLGYKPEFAGAVEAAASTGGQLMPPIMGAAAFLMAESLGVAYTDVVKAAVIPAILYFSGVWIVVHFEAKKYGLQGLPRDQLPKLRLVLKERGILLLPIVGIVYFLISGYTASYAALMGIGFSLFASVLLFALTEGFKYMKDPQDSSIKVDSKEFAKDFVKGIFDALIQGPRNMLSVAVACGMAGMIVGVVTLTGVGLKMGNGLVSLAGGNMMLTLVLTMIASIILGMGAPTTANYIITSTITAPAIVAVGVLNGYDIPMIAAHMFAFYFGIVADITPPVALAAMAGSAIAKGNPFKTGVNASKLAIAAFLIPYMFIYNPQMLMVEATTLTVLQITVTAILGMVGVGTSLQGWFFTKCNVIERILLLGSGLALIKPGITTDIIGSGIIIALGFISYYKKRNEKSALSSS